MNNEKRAKNFESQMENEIYNYGEAWLNSQHLDRYKCELCII